ncbi:MAG: hypothetical protein ACHRHE_13345 [Tepidisphaerales bacterium]
MDTSPQPQPPSPSDAGASAGAPRREGARLVGVLICAVAAAFLLFVGTIYDHSWLHKPDAKGVLIIEGGPEFDGARVRVTPLGSPPLEGVLAESEKHKLRFVLDAGVYSLRVWRGDQVFYDQPTFDIKELQTAKLTLWPKVTPTRPVNR